MNGGIGGGLINFVQLADVSLSIHWICCLCVSKSLKMNKNRIVVSFEDHNITVLVEVMVFKSYTMTEKKNISKDSVSLLL